MIQYGPDDNGANDIISHHESVRFSVHTVHRDNTSIIQEEAYASHAESNAVPGETLSVRSRAVSKSNNTSMQFSPEKQRNNQLEVIKPRAGAKTKIKPRYTDVYQSDRSSNF
jgi:hypothetical protein